MGAVFSLIMGWYFWVYVFTGLGVSEFFSWVFLVGFFIGVNITFLPMHTLGLDGMPRRYITYARFMSNYNRFCSLRLLCCFWFRGEEDYERLFNSQTRFFLVSLCLLILKLLSSARKIFLLGFRPSTTLITF